MRSLTHRRVALFATWASLGVLCGNSLIFSSQEICRTADPASCYEGMSGLLHILNSETSVLSINRLQDNTVTASSDSFPEEPAYVIRMTKSLVSYSYPLTYQIDVFDAFREDVHTFTYDQVGNDPEAFCFDADKNRNLCASNPLSLAKDPQGEPLQWAYGRCCWCPTTTVGTAPPAYRRADFTCNWLDLNYKKGTWTSKSCPRVIEPWYSALAIGYPPQWYFAIKIEISFRGEKKREMAQRACENRVAKGRVPNSTDCNLKNSHTYLLNPSVTQLVDDAVGISLRIVDSGPVTGPGPPDLSSKYLFVPYAPVDNPMVMASSMKHGCSLEAERSIEFFEDDGTDPERVSECAKNAETCRPVSCLKHSMLIPSEFVDLSGLTCNKIGTSLSTWGNMMGRFCDYAPGSCMGNQVGSFRQSDEARMASGLKGEHSLTPLLGGAPMYFQEPPFSGTNIKDTNSRHFLGYMYPLDHQTTVEMTLDGASVTVHEVSAPGLIRSIVVPLPALCTSGSKELCALLVNVQNVGEQAARFTVRVPQCRVGTEATELVSPISPVGKLVDSKEVSVFTLAMTYLSPTATNVACTVELLDGTGRVRATDNAAIVFGKLKRESQGGGQLQQETGVTTTTKRDAARRQVNQCDCGINPVCIFGNWGSCLTSWRIWLYGITWCIFAALVLGLLIVLAFCCLPCIGHCR